MGKISKLTKASIQALEQTAEAVHTDLVQSQTMPFGESLTETYKEYGKRGQFKKDGSEYKGRTKTRVVRPGGNLQNNQTFVDYSDSRKGNVSIIFNTPYARRLYYHPEYNFNKEENPDAGGEWAESYMEGGEKQDFAPKAFKQFYKQSGGL